jgi:cation diffusion facilitator CzcD-associated flavoprotein CzcO
MRQDMKEYSYQVNGTTNGQPSGLDVDCLIIGAGFGGIYLLHHLRKLGYNCKIYEAGSDLGGVWHWNCYPGARVDSMVPVYEYSIPEVWKDWTWSEAYPGWQELRRYFEHVDKILDVRKDVVLEKRVTGADYDTCSGRWAVQTQDGSHATCKFLLIATGFAAKRYFPDWKGLDTFKGAIHHSSFWPEDGVDVKGKRVAVIGTGSTGVQIAQETAKEDIKSLTVFQRTPNLALPMAQRTITREQQEKDKSRYPQFFRDRTKTFAGFQYDFVKRNTMDDTPEQREAFYEKLWQHGGFEFWLGTYQDMLFDDDANLEAYKFWLKKTRPRIHDPVTRDILAPLEPPHAFGTKRPSLEQDYYEQFNKPNVNIVDIKANPVVEVKPEGIVTADGKLHELDVIALATGFDSVTGGMKNMGLRNVYGETLNDTWKLGTWSYLGMTCNGYPNMFFLYGPQGPTAFSNGPSCVETQGYWILAAINKIQSEGIKSVNPTKAAEEAWRQNVAKLSNKTLFPKTDSWYMGANIPGKPREQLNYAGGIPLYEEEIHRVLNNGWEGFEVVSA